MTLQRQDFRFVHRLRVRWAEVDMQKIVFNGHYLMYLDTAMGGYWRSLALPYQDAMVLLKGDTFVKKVTLEYHASARYDEVVRVTTRLMAVRSRAVEFAYEITRPDDGARIVSATTTLISVNEEGRPVALDQGVRTLLEAGSVVE